MPSNNNLDFSTAEKNYYAKIINSSDIANEFQLNKILNKYPDLINNIKLPFTKHFSKKGDINTTTNGWNGDVSSNITAPIDKTETVLEKKYGEDKYNQYIKPYFDSVKNLLMFAKKQVLTGEKIAKSNDDEKISVLDMAKRYEKEKDSVQQEVDKFKKQDENKKQIKKYLDMIYSIVKNHYFNVNFQHLYNNYRLAYQKNHGKSATFSKLGWLLSQAAQCKNKEDFEQWYKNSIASINNNDEYSEYLRRDKEKVLNYKPWYEQYVQLVTNFKEKLKNLENGIDDINFIDLIPDYPELDNIIINAVSKNEEIGNIVNQILSVNNDDKINNLEKNLKIKNIIKNNYEVIREAINKNPRIFNLFPENVEIDELGNLQDELLDKNIENIAYMKNINYDAAKKIINDDNLFPYIKNIPFEKIDSNIKQDIISDDKKRLVFLHNKSNVDDEYVKVAQQIEQNPEFIRLLNDVFQDRYSNLITNSLKKSSDGKIIQYIKNPTYEQQKIALEKNINNIKYIKNLDPELANFISKNANNISPSADQILMNQLSLQKQYKPNAVDLVRQDPNNFFDLNPDEQNNEEVQKAALDSSTDGSFIIKMKKAGVKMSDEILRLGMKKLGVNI